MCGWIVGFMLTMETGSQMCYRAVAEDRHGGRVFIIKLQMVVSEAGRE